MFFPPTTAVEVLLAFSTIQKGCKNSDFAFGNWMSVQPAFPGRYIQPINNLQTSLRLKTVKHGGSAASFLHTSQLPPAALSRLPSPTWHLQLWLLLAEPKADTTPVTLSLCACLEQSHTSPAQPHQAGASHLSSPSQPPGTSDSRF